MTQIRTLAASLFVVAVTVTIFLSSSAFALVRDPP
jgi:hypothetical protein